MSQNYLQMMQDLARITMGDAGAPIATGEMGRLHNTPAYTARGLPNIVWEHVQVIGADHMQWACYDSRGLDPRDGPVGYGETIDAALVRFRELYGEESA